VSSGKLGTLQTDVPPLGPCPHSISQSHISDAIQNSAFKFEFKLAKVMLDFTNIPMDFPSIDGDVPPTGQLWENRPQR
jgi:hypothetical protein